MGNFITAKKIVKTYGKGDTLFTALNDISMTIEEGDSIAIVGKSGSGKSTLMHLLALLDSPTSGSLTVRGQDTTKLKRNEVDLIRNAEFGFVFQQFFLNANDTVLNNVVLPLMIAGVPVKERKSRGLKVLKAVELEDKVDSKANDLSGGQKQRVAIARALVNNPKVIFADEPTGNLDSATGGKIEDLLFRLNAKNGITLIVVTHDEDLASRCRRKVYIKDGKVMKDKAKK